MNIQMNIHFNIHSVFKTFRVFCLGQVVLQLLQAPRSPPETFLGVGGMFTRPIILYAFDTIYQRLCKHRLYAAMFSMSDESIVY